MERTAGVAVLVTRLDEELGVEVALPGRRELLSEQGTGRGVSSKEMDWIVRSEAYTLRGQPTDPEKRDEIRWRQADGSVRVYKVVPAADERCFDTVDTYGVRLRIHTTFQGVEKEGDAV